MPLLSTIDHIVDPRIRAERRLHRFGCRPSLVQSQTHVVVAIFGRVRAGAFCRLALRPPARALPAQTSVAPIRSLACSSPELPGRSAGQHKLPDSTTTREHQPRHYQRKFCAQPELHRRGSYSPSALSLPYSFNLLCSVFKLMPSNSAARVLLLSRRGQRLQDQFAFHRVHRRADREISIAPRSLGLFAADFAEFSR